MSDSETENQNAIPSLSEQLTANFYRWETRGRGWQVRPDAVDLEPAFEPFFHYYSPVQSGVDDGRRHTFISSLTEKLYGLFIGTGANKPRQTSEEPPLDEPEPLLFEESSALHEITVSLSAEQKISTDYVEQFLLNLCCCSCPLSW